MTARRPRLSAAARSTSGDKRSGGQPVAAGADCPVVAIGASAGGLEACQKLFDGLGAVKGAAFLVVQHLDPKHKSLMAELLSEHTDMEVLEAVDGVRVDPGRAYVIPPGTYMSVEDGLLRVSAPDTARGARRPFDALLNSLAKSVGPRTICVVLSGSLDDGSLGVKAVKASGGAVIAQDPDEAGFDGMPRGAILTGDVDLILPVAKIPAAIARIIAGLPAVGRAAARRGDGGVLSQIVALVHDRVGKDFTTYKPGTLHRRIMRRMALASIPPAAMDRYLERLLVDPDELEMLAKDLLIHVTGFFRDAPVFALLAGSLAVDLARGRAPDDPIRIWVAGCSTGEEAYSIAIILTEAIAAVGGHARLQIFASDIDPDSVATAREGLYSEAIVDSVSPARLARFFTRVATGYQASAELRGCVVFTVQNLLTDPPFSRLDLVSCRNLLIYLRPEAQAKVLSIFHFALKPGGALLLGASEGVGRAEAQFEALSKPARLYRQVGRVRGGDLSFIASAAARRGLSRSAVAAAVTAQKSLAELCRRLVLETHAPAAVLINRGRECLYSLGPTDRYLRVAVGAPSLDVLAMARHGIRARLDSAITQAFADNQTVLVHSGPLTWEKKVHAFDIEARPVQAGGETLLLLCFLDRPRAGGRPGAAHADEDGSRIKDLEAELAGVRAELASAVRNLEIAGEEQTTINEEALSVSEEYQSTNEELITSKEELQSLNEELNALNGQLQETLDRQRTTAADLQNILYSADVATVFLDKSLRIRFFTPSARSLFSVIPTDIGRPLADLNALAEDPDLLSDARAMLRAGTPLSREIEAVGGGWFLRRLMPYRAEGDAIEGVVITYIDITEKKQNTRNLEAATLAANSANRAKSRFLAAASHDLRQPLQTLTLIQGLLTRKVRGEAEQKLIRLQEHCLGAMSGMLNTLLDINQIDAGVVKPVKTVFPVNTIFDRIKDEFAYHADAKGLTLRLVSCSHLIVSDPALLEQMIRNLVANAVKYTSQGAILLGCRRRGGRLSIQVLDTGIGMDPAELYVIFDEYHQIENPARERSRGLGLGLSIVKRLGELLDHHVDVRSTVGHGSRFSVDVDLAPSSQGAPASARNSDPATLAPTRAKQTADILVVEDDPEVRELLELVLVDEGHRVTAAVDGAQAVALLGSTGVRPAVVLVDYNLPGSLNGLQLAARLRRTLGLDSPVVVLTGDISSETLRDIAAERCVPLHKPVKPGNLLQVIQDLLTGQQAPSDVARSPILPVPRGSATIFVVDDDETVRSTLRLVLEDGGLAVRTFADAESFLDAERPAGPACLLTDAHIPGGMGGLELLQRLRALRDTTPAIMITGEADVVLAVQAMKAGAADFIEKPIRGPELLASIAQVLEKAAEPGKAATARVAAAARLAGLTQRQRDILDRVLAGHPSKNIAADLGISQRTVENHRAAIMRRTGVRSMPALARLAVAAIQAGEPPVALAG